MTLVQHIDQRLLIGYRDLEVTAAAAASIEAHLTVCSVCREAFARLPQPVASSSVPDAEEMWHGIVDVVDRPHSWVLDRLLGVLGIPEHPARVLAVAPSLRAAWLTAVALVCLFAIVASSRDGGDPWPLLVLAPLVPLVGVAASYGSVLDPSHEMSIATPSGGLRMVLLQTIAVLATSLPLLAVATPLVPGTDADAIVWLIPAMALVAVTMALSSWMPPERAGIAAGITWLTLSTVLVHRDRAGDFMARSMLFGPTGLTITGLLAGCSVLVVGVRRQSYGLLIVTGG